MIKYIARNRIVSDIQSHEITGDGAYCRSANQTPISIKESAP